MPKTRQPTKSFPPSYWDPPWRAYLYLAEFSAKNGDASNAKKKNGREWLGRISIAPWDPKGVEDEIEELRLKQKQGRPERLDAIRAQAEDPFTHFFRRLMFKPSSHPKTFELMHVAILVGRAVVMHFKGKFERARPSQYAPDLEPPLEVPGHASYPSGHSTQMHLMARVLADVVPSARPEVEALATEIAENREYAGLHYESDTTAGIELARQTFDILTECSLYKATLVEAKKEW